MIVKPPLLCHLHVLTWIPIRRIDGMQYSSSRWLDVHRRKWSQLIITQLISITVPLKTCKWYSPHCLHNMGWLVVLQRGSFFTWIWAWFLDNLLIWKRSFWWTSMSSVAYSHQDTPIPARSQSISSAHKIYLFEYGVDNRNVQIIYFSLLNTCGAAHSMFQSVHSEITLEVVWSKSLWSPDVWGFWARCSQWDRNPSQMRAPRLECHKWMNPVCDTKFQSRLE